MKIDFLGFTIDYLTIFGLTAQFLFFLRFVYQWIISEKRKESIIPIEFWYFSIIGGVLIIIYAFLRRDLVFFLGQIFALFIYTRNLILLKKKISVRENLKKYKTKNPIKKYFINQFLRKISDLINQLEVKRILDVGCGEGQVIDYLLKLNPKIKFLGIDNSRIAIDFAKRNVGKDFLIGDIYSLPENLFHKDFDITLVIEVLEHLDNPKKALKELKKIKTNYYLFSVPNEPWFSLGNLLMGKNIQRLGKDKDHKWFWSRKEFINFLKEDFEIIKVIKTYFWTVILAK